jgi:hypothetical protein
MPPSRFNQQRRPRGGKCRTQDFLGFGRPGTFESEIWDMFENHPPGLLTRGGPNPKMPNPRFLGLRQGLQDSRVRFWRCLNANATAHVFSPEVAPGRLPTPNFLRSSRAAWKYERANTRERNSVCLAHPSRTSSLNCPYARRMFACIKSESGDRQAKPSESGMSSFALD